MNILIFDATDTVGPLARTSLRNAGHRVSTESDAAAARLKLETALFDVVIAGPEGFPESLAAYLEQEWPVLPLVLAGGDFEFPAAAPVAAVLARPLSIQRLVAALRKIERQAAADARKNYDMPVDVLAGERRLACRVVRIARGSVMLERPWDEVAPVEGPADVIAQGSPLSFGRGGVQVSGDVAFRDSRLVAVRLTSEALVSLQQLEVGDAQGRRDQPHRGGLPGL